jgi:DnaJ homologue, subfamily C, member 28, conserved domain
MDKFIDEQIRKAIEAGEFDDLSGKGKPIELSTYFETPEDLRMAYSILKSNNFVPEEVEILKEIDDLKRRLAVCTEEDEKSKITKEINDKNYAFNMLIEKRRR